MNAMTIALGHHPQGVAHWFERQAPATTIPVLWRAGLSVEGIGTGIRRCRSTYRVLHCRRKGRQVGRSTDVEQGHRIDILC